MTVAVLGALLSFLQQVLHLILTGTFLGIGFWTAKLITQKLDEYRVLLDKKFMAELNEAV